MSVSVASPGRVARAVLRFTRLLLLLATCGMACDVAVRPSTQTPGGVLRVLRTSSGSGSAVLVQASECVSREADLRLIREVLAPSSVGLLDTQGRRPSEELVTLVGVERFRIGLSGRFSQPKSENAQGTTARGSDADGTS